MKFLPFPHRWEFFFFFVPHYFIDGSSSIESSQLSTFLPRRTCETSPDDTTTASFFPFFFLLFALPVSSGNIPICSSCAPSPLLPCPPRPPPSLPPAPSPESGRPRCHHSPLGDNRHKGGLGGPGCGPLGAQRHWGERKVPHLLPIPSSPPSSPPPQTMKTLSVQIRKERCASAEGATVIKATPPHLCTSIPLSTYSLSVALYQFWDSEPFHAAFTLPNCC